MAQKYSYLSELLVKMKFDNGIVMRGLGYVYLEIYVFAGDLVLESQRIRVTDGRRCKPGERGFRSK